MSTKNNSRDQFNSGFTTSYFNTQNFKAQDEMRLYLIIYLTHVSRETQLSCETRKMLHQYFYS